MNTYLSFILFHVNNKVEKAVTPQFFMVNLPCHSRYAVSRWEKAGIQVFMYDNSPLLSV
jgi:hypothetical protein